MIMILIPILILTGVDIHLGVLNLLLGGDGQGQYRAVPDAFHFYPGNGGSLSGVVKFPLHHQIGLSLLEQAAPLDNISASNHVVLTWSLPMIEPIYRIFFP
jgi:hypothetical protein